MELMEENSLDFFCKDEGMEKERRNRIYIKQSLILNPVVRTVIDCMSHCCYFCSVYAVAMSVG